MDRQRIRVLVVEDHLALAENLFEFLGQQDYILDFAQDGLTALHLVATNSYDIIILDVMLPGLSGFELCRRLRDDLRCTTPVIMMTARDSIDDKARGFEGGADDYLVKPFNLRELELRIRALHRRQRSDLDLLRAPGVSYDPGTLTVRLDNGAQTELTGLPARLLEQLFRAYPRYLSHEQLGQSLWGDSDGDWASLRTHIYALRKTLQQGLGINLVKTVHGRGYRLEPPVTDDNRYPDR